MTENYKLIADLAKKDVATLEEKGKSYGGSWKKRGGVGAFMMLARKWDRIETICKDNGYDIFEALSQNVGGLADDIEDLRCYLLLVQAHVESEVRDYPNQALRAKPHVPKSDSVHQIKPQSSHCKVCGSPGNHAGLTCPRALPGSTMGLKDEQAPRIDYGGTGYDSEDLKKDQCEAGPGYVDQDHDPYSRK